MVTTWSRSARRRRPTPPHNPPNPPVHKEATMAPLWRLRGCPRCGGDLWREPRIVINQEIGGWVCLQCGHRPEPPQQEVDVDKTRIRACEDCGRTTKDLHPPCPPRQDRQAPVWGVWNPPR